MATIFEELAALIRQSQTGDIQVPRDFANRILHVLTAGSGFPSVLPEAETLAATREMITKIDLELLELTNVEAG